MIIVYPKFWNFIIMRFPVLRELCSRLETVTCLTLYDNYNDSVLPFFTLTLDKKTSVILSLTVTGRPYVSKSWYYKMSGRRTGTPLYGIGTGPTRSHLCQ